jgi:hypothetical protein
MGTTTFYTHDEWGRPSARPLPTPTPDPPPAVQTEWLVGLDLGQAQDFAAWAAVERQQAGSAPAHYYARDLYRWPLGTKYPEVVDETVVRLGRSPLQPRGRLIIDMTGCGRPVFDMFRERQLGSRLHAVTITAGTEAVQAAPGHHHVPKAELIGQLQVLLQTRRLHVAPALPHTPTLLRELEGYQMRITAAAHILYGQWREGEHDDLVLALALACWYGERGRRRVQVF